MKQLSFIRYFIYLAWNWNITIAWKIIKEEVWGEKKYDIDTTGADELKKLEERGIDVSHATIYMPASYRLLEEIFAQLGIQDHAVKTQNPKHLLDIGCGKGRALCVAAHFGFQKLTGIDLSREFCETATQNLRLTSRHIPGVKYNIINTDAFHYRIPADANYIFLFNPFDEVIMSGVLNNILTSLHASPREIAIVYINPLHKGMFIEAGFRETWHIKKMQYLEASILSL